VLRAQVDTEEWGFRLETESRQRWDRRRRGNGVTEGMKKVEASARECAWKRMSEGGREEEEKEEPGGK